MNDASRRAGLRDKIDRLDEAEVAVVERFVDAVLTPVHHEVLPGSWLATAAWTDAFRARLRAHHALNAEPLSRTAFEAAFNAACEAAGWKVRPAASAVNRFFDTVVDVPGRGPLSFSLKATAAKRMNRASVHISKLTEAAWIQDARTQTARHEKIVELFSSYREQTASIFVLRGFRQPDEAVDYELLELPTTAFAGVDELSVGQAQAATIPIPPNTTPADLKIRIDRSDAKVTITGIRIEVCTVHGRWLVPNLSGVSED